MLEAGVLVYSAIYQTLALTLRKGRVVHLFQEWLH